MSKAKVRSMQRGAQKRSSEPPLRMQEIYKKHPPRVSNADKPHLDFVKYGKLAYWEKIKTVAEAAKKNGIGTASEISRLLNKLLIKTAIGEKWTPRLAWFATRAIRVHNQERRDQTVDRNRGGQSPDESKFHNMVNRVVKSRLDEIRDDFEASRPTLGEISPGLAGLKKRLESNDG